MAPLAYPRLTDVAAPKRQPCSQRHHHALLLFRCPALRWTRVTLKVAGAVPLVAAARGWITESGAGHASIFKKGRTGTYPGVCIDDQFACKATPTRTPARRVRPS